jgi:hypothetical protein
MSLYDDLPPPSVGSDPVAVPVSASVEKPKEKEKKVEIKPPKLEVVKEIVKKSEVVNG